MTAVALELIVALLFLALVAYVAGARGVGGLSMEVARVLVVALLLLAVVAWFAGP